MRHVLAAAVTMPLLLAAGGCKRSTPAASPTPTPQAAASPVASAALATTAPVIAYFEKAGDRCEWVHHDPIAGTRSVKVGFPGDCTGARVAWSHDRARALVWLEPDDGEPSYFEVPPRALAPLKSVEGSLRAMGYDKEGRVIALSLVEVTDAQRKQGFAMADGAKLPIPSEMEGIPVLARAWRAEGTAWKKFETKVSDDAWDLAQGAMALEAHRTLGPSSWEILSKVAEGEMVDDAAKKALDAGCGAAPEMFGEWLRFGGSLHMRVEESDFVIVMPPVCVLSDGKAAPLAGTEFDPDDSLAAQTRAPYELVTDSVGARPHLVDTRTNQVVWKSAAARGAVFLP